jgi:rubrerythrin
MAEPRKKTYVTMRQLMELAIQFEMDSAAFYRRMRSMSSEAPVRELLQTLEEEEKDHERILRGYTPPQNEELRLQFAPELTLSMPALGRDTDFAGMLMLAIERERRSVDMYADAAGRTMGEFRELLENLASFEREHERKLQRLQAARSRQ